MAKELFWFEELGPEHHEIVGKKCANLGGITRLKMPVPGGFAISIKAHGRFLEETGALQEIEQLLSRVGDISDFNRQSEVADQIRDIVEGKEMPSDLQDGIGAFYGELCRRIGCEAAVSVRSAGAKSHPGQYETYLNVKGRRQVLEMVKRVWSSIFNARTIAKLLELGIPVSDSPPIGVGVVQMVNARSAGVCFTVHPVTGDLAKAVVEANWGLGESVVGGSASTDMYVVAKESLQVIESTVPWKNIQIVATGEGVVEEEVPLEKQNASVLDEREVIEIVRLGKALEEHFGHPQDLEWAIDDERPFPYNVFLLQTRNVVGVTIQKPKTTEQKAVDEVMNRFFGYMHTKR
jgi:pyruvate,water dikinase